MVTSFNFKENVVDQGLYLKVSESKFVIMILYLDVILLASNDPVSAMRLKKDLDEASVVLHSEIHRDRFRGVLGFSRSLN